MDRDRAHTTHETHIGSGTDPKELLGPGAANSAAPRDLVLGKYESHGFYGPKPDPSRLGNIRDGQGLMIWSWGNKVKSRKVTVVYLMGNLNCLALMDAKSALPHMWAGRGRETVGGRHAASERAVCGKEFVSYRSASTSDH